MAEAQMRRRWERKLRRLLFGEEVGRVQIGNLI